MTPNEKVEIWDSATFVFDTNVLLNLYRYSPPTRQGFVDVLESIHDKVWIPHQVAFEFMKNRIDVIAGSSRRYESVQSDADNFIASVKKCLSLDGKNADILRLKRNIDSWVKKHKKANADIVINPSEDSVLATILRIFDTRTGDPYTEEELKMRYKEGRERFEKKVPPGYLDGKKPDNEYGDYIIWREMIDYAKKCKTSIVFVSDDVKEDWVYTKRGNHYGPRPELIREFAEETGQSFLLYSTEHFLKCYSTRNPLTPKEEMMSEVREVATEQVAKRRVTPLDESPISALRGQELANWTPGLISAYLNSIDMKEYELHSAIYEKWSAEIDRASKIDPSIFDWYLRRNNELERLQREYDRLTSLEEHVSHADEVDDDDQSDSK